LFTAEQYQQHQEQLALMQKQQLEQQANNANTTNAQGLVSKTLDQATAQFAASALVTTEQLLAFKSKEELVLAGGVNGVLPPTGVFKGLHLPSPAPVPHHQQHHNNQSTTAAPAAATPTFLQPNSAPPFHSAVGTHPTSLSSAAVRHNNSNAAAAALGLLGCGNPNSSTAAAAASSPTTQVLIGNNIRLSMPSVGGLAGRHHHLPRALGNVPPSALKLAATNNLVMPKVSAAPAMDLGSRDNHDQDTPSLNSIADNTVAMEVT
jgi:enhancer of polycomb-like protein